MKYSRLTIFTLFLLFPFLGLAQDSSNAENSTDIDRIFKLVPVKQTLTEVPKDLKNQFAQNPFQISASKNSKLVQLYGEAYHADSLLKMARKSFKENFDARHTDSVLTTLTSEKIKPVLNAEAEFYTLQGTRKQIVTKYELEQRKPSEEHISIIKDLIEQTSAKKSVLESQTILFRSLVIGSDAISNNLNISETQVNSIVDNFKNRLQMQLEDELVDNYLVMYHGLDNELIRHYADFYATEAGTEFKESLNEAVHTAFKKASEQLISNIESL